MQFLLFFVYFHSALFQVIDFVKHAMKSMKIWFEMNWVRTEVWNCICWPLFSIVVGEMLNVVCFHHTSSFEHCPCFLYMKEIIAQKKLRKNRSLKNVFVDRLFNSFHWGGWYVLISHIITWTNFMLWSVKEMIQFTHDFNVESFHHRFEVRDVWFGFQGDEVQDRFFPVYLTRYQLNYRVRNCDFSVR